MAKLPESVKAVMPKEIQQILEDVEYFRDQYFVYDEPLPYKDFMLYPVSVKNYNEFLSASECLILNKNDDIKGLRMTYIDYLIDKLQDEKEGPIWSMKFTKIVELCFHIPPGLKCKNCGKIMTFEEFYMKYEQTPPEKRNELLHCDCGGDFIETIKFAENDKKKKVFILDGKEMNNEDFNKVRKYIMYQNLPDFKDDSWVDKAIRDDQAALNEIKSRDVGTASLERKIVGLCANMHWTLDNAYALSIRKFLMYLSMIDDIMDYKILKTGLSSGFVSLPKGETIEHWLYKKDKGLYGKAIGAETYKNQIQKA